MARDGVLDEAGFVDRVGVNGHLHVELVGDRQALIDRRRRRSPVLVQLESERAGANLLAQRLGAGSIAFAEKAEIQREGLGRLVHPADIPRLPACMSSLSCPLPARSRRRSAS